MIKLLYLPFFLFISTLSAQEELFNISESIVNISELKAQSYSKDSTANAFYIHENGYSRFLSKHDFNLVTDYTAKIKILNKNGFDQANIEIKLYKNSRKKEKLIDLKATTHYIENGIYKSQFLSSDKVYTEEHPEYDIVKFTFPNVKPGAVLVYSYQKESPFIYNFEKWWFQGDIPKMYSRYLAEIPGNYYYNIKLVGYQKLDFENNDIKKKCLSVPGISQPADCAQLEYIMQNIPSFKEEKYLTSKYNYISRIEFELQEVTSTDGFTKKYSKSWDDVDRELRSNYDLGKKLRRTKWAQGILPENIHSQPNNLNKAISIYDFVKKHYKWNGEYKIFKDFKTKDLLEEKTGNISAINILLHNIYKEEGFKVLPLLTSTRSNGVPTKLYPVLSEFNYLMVQLEIDEATYLLDATEKNAAFGIIPFRALNKYGRLLDFGNGSSWVDLEPSGYSKIDVRDSIALNRDGTSSGTSVHSFSGYHALSVRNKIDEIDLNNIFNILTNPNESTKSIEEIVLNKEDLSNDLIITYQLENDSQKINNKIYFKPFSFKFFAENPFKLNERNYPIDFGYNDTYSYSILLIIPDTHEVIEIPEQKIVALPKKGGSIHFFAKQINETVINIHCRLKFSNSSYGPEYYFYLKKFMETLNLVQEQSIILIQEKAS